MVSKRIKNWDRYQYHWDGRNITWIKLYKQLLDDMEWNTLSGEAAKLLINLWLLASESNGALPPDEKIMFRLRIPKSHYKQYVAELSHFVTDCDDLGAFCDRIGAICDDPGAICDETGANCDGIVALDKKRLDKKRKDLVREMGFETFWHHYPRKVGKGAAEKAWDKVGASLPTVLSALSWQAISDDWTRDSGKFIPHPSTYLNQRRYEDEPPEVVKPSSGAPQKKPVLPDPEKAAPAEEALAALKKMKEAL